MTTKLKADYKIKTVRGDLVVATKGMELMSMLSKKADLEKALKSSIAHKWLLDLASNTQPHATTNVPSTDTNTFKTKAYYHTVKMVVENLVQLEGLSITEAIKEGNTLINGGVVVSDHPVITCQIKDALRYRGTL